MATVDFQVLLLQIHQSMLFSELTGIRCDDPVGALQGCISGLC